MAFNHDHIRWFRDSSPYIDLHRGRTFVLCLPDRALESENLNNIISDVALLTSLGVRLAVVYGAELQIETTAGVTWPEGNSRRITDAAMLQTAIRVLGEVTSDLTARISASNPDSPGPRRDINTVTGNFLRARPLGIIDGIDHLQTGEVRRVNRSAIKHQLDGGSVVLVPAIGYSPSGEIFQLDTHATASQVAQALDADKLVYFSDDEGLRNNNGDVINEIDLSHLEQADLADGNGSLLKLCNQACQAGVSRCHIISFDVDGALVEELFTRDGCGTQIVGHSYESIRSATIDDVPGILRLMEPLENEGVLVKRSRELLESEIDRFVVIDRDGLLISCAALYQWEAMGELACLVTHPDYRKSDRGDRLLEVIESKARAAGMDKLFVLTTQSAHWFAERGFQECEISSLPESRKDFYNFQRNSRVLIKPVS